MKCECRGYPQDMRSVKQDYSESVDLTPVGSSFRVMATTRDVAEYFWECSTCGRIVEEGNNAVSPL